MRRHWTFVACLCFLCCSAQAPVPTGALHFDQNRFSIAPLEAKAQGVNYTVVMMFLPASDGFAPNVNVIIQSYTGTLDQYMALNKQQFEQLKFTVIKQTKVDAHTVLYEYTGTAGPNACHWYSKAVQKADQIYLATATATQAQWPKIGTQMTACVDSMQMDKE